MSAHCLLRRRDVSRLQGLQDAQVLQASGVISRGILRDDVARPPDLVAQPIHDFDELAVAAVAEDEVVDELIGSDERAQLSCLAPHPERLLAPTDDIIKRDKGDLDGRRLDSQAFQGYPQVKNVLEFLEVRCRDEDTATRGDAQEARDGKLPHSVPYGGGADPPASSEPVEIEFLAGDEHP